MSDGGAGNLAGSNCFACGPENPIGLRIPFVIEDDVCIGRYTPAPPHIGYDDVVHGGLLFTALDDVMANWLYLQDIKAYTGKASIRYRRAAKVGVPLRLEGRCAQRRGRLAMMTSVAIEEVSGDLVCEADATFMLVK